MQWPEPLWETPNESILTSRSSLKEVSCGVVFSVPKTHIPRWYGATKGDSSDVTTMMLVVTRARQTNQKPTEVKHNAPHHRPPPRSVPRRPRLSRLGEDLPEPIGSDPRCGPGLVEKRAYHVLEERREGCCNWINNTRLSYHPCNFFSFILAFTSSREIHSSLVARVETPVYPSSRGNVVVLVSNESLGLAPSQNTWSPLKYVPGLHGGVGREIDCFDERPVRRRNYLPIASVCFFPW